MDCPTCRVPMGQGKSLLALTVIKNVLHECRHQGCNVKLSLDEIKQHEEMCVWRPIPCPGRDSDCKADIPLCNMLSHVQGCAGCKWLGVQAAEKGISFENRIRVENVGKQNWRSWRTKVFKSEEGQLFFVKVARNEGTYKVDVLMEGSQEDCEDFMVEASVLSEETRDLYFL